MVHALKHTWKHELVKDGEDRRELEVYWVFLSSAMVTGRS